MDRGLKRGGYCEEEMRGRMRRGVMVDEYMRVTLASVLSNRLREEVEGRGLVPQAGFRRGVGTVDNIYTLNYLINRQVSKASDKLLAFFVDLRVAFDSVDRGG